MRIKRRRSDSFVFRIWWEEDGWRGWVQHAVSGENRYFERLPDLLHFVEARTGPLEQDVEGVGRRGGIKEAVNE